MTNRDNVDYTRQTAEHKEAATDKNYPWLEDGEEADMADRMAASLFSADLPFRYWSTEQKLNYVKGLREFLRKDGWEVKEPGNSEQQKPESDDFEFFRDPESWNRSRKV